MNENIKYSGHVYAGIKKERVHFVRIFENNPSFQRDYPDLSSFKYLMQVDYKEDYVMGMQEVPEDKEKIKQLLATFFIEKRKQIKEARRVCRELLQV